MMKTTHTIVLLSIAGCLFTGLAAQAEVYKTVDEDGNVVFTDQQPTPDAEPLKMRELSVVPVPEMAPKAVRAKENQGNEDGEVVDLGALRRGYRDFRITQPMPEQTFTGTSNVATVAWDTQYELQEGMQVVFSINGQALPATTQQIIATEPLDRGEHTVSATLVDKRNRNIATAQPVTFFVRQYSANFNRPRAAPRSGG